MGDYSRKIKRAIIQLQGLQPFFSYVAMNLRIIETERIPTMAVDGNLNLYYNRNFVEHTIRSEKILIGCICHESLHVALEHIGRVGNRHRMISNIAQDMVVNMICVTNGLNVIQGKGYVNVDSYSNTGSVILKDKEIKVNNITKKSWEKVYEDIISQLDDPEETEKSLSNIPSLCFDSHLHDEFEKLSKKEKNILKERIKDMVLNGYTLAKQMGNVPGNLDYYLDSLLNPKISWQNKLRSYMKESIDPRDLTYRRPHRKSHALNIYTPSIIKEGIELYIVIDTSGSISMDIYKEFISEVSGILNSYNSVNATLVFGDTEIRNEYNLKSSDTNKLKSLLVKGGGGTDMEFILSQIKDRRVKIPLVIILTDGYTNCVQKAQDFPFKVLWVLTKDGESEHLKYGDKLVIK